MKQQTNNYYKNQLAKIPADTSCSFKILSANREQETNWMDLNHESAEDLMNFIFNKFQNENKVKLLIHSLTVVHEFLNSSAGNKCPNPIKVVIQGEINGMLYILNS